MGNVGESKGDMYQYRYMSEANPRAPVHVDNEGYQLVSHGGNM